MSVVNALVENINRVIVGKTSTIELMLVALISEGHVLLEDVPGTGKTMLAKSLCQSLDLNFSRVQFTPDLLPSDVTGVSFYNHKDSSFEFRPGPAFANVLLADEINRATPRTQSSLLECMEERQITVDGITHPLPRPHMVIATQNPVELEGTFPLPEAQLDRFLLRLSLGYPSQEEELAMLDRFMRSDPLATLAPVAGAPEIKELQQQAKAVRLSGAVAGYILDITARTRTHEELRLGASPRASLALARASRALALVKGRHYVLPDDVKSLALPVLAHRLLPDYQLRVKSSSPQAVLEQIVADTPVPVAADEA